MKLNPYITNQETLTLIPTINVHWDKPVNKPLLYIDVCIAWGQLTIGLMWQNKKR